MFSKSALLAAVAAGVVAQHANAAIRISEVFVNPETSGDGSEFIEIYNDSNAVVDLTNYKIGSEETRFPSSSVEDMYQFPAGTQIAANGYLVVAMKGSGADSFATEFPTVTVSGEAQDTSPTIPNLIPYTGWFTGTPGSWALANGGDHALLVGPDDVVVDALNWGNVSTPLNPAIAAPGSGISLHRTDVLSDTDTAADWSTGAPSPTHTVIPEPASLSLLALGALAVGRRRR